MALQPINIGSQPNDGTGDTVRNAFIKTNQNFTELFDNYNELLDLNLSHPDEWVRPSDWKVLDIPSDNQQKFIALYAVRNNPYNYCAFIVSGNYTVDWGDGTVENYSSGAKAEHQFDFTDAVLTDSLTSEGFKQAIITVTPQDGSNLTSIDLGVKHSFYDGKTVVVEAGYLDFVLVGQYLTTFKVTQTANLTSVEYTATKNLENSGDLLYSIPYEYDADNSSVNTEVVFNLLYQFYIGKNVLTTITENFHYCINLKRIERLDLSNSSCFAINVFEGCQQLETVKNFKITSPSAFRMFEGCVSLKYIDSEKISAKDCESMFYGCYSLKYAKIKDFSGVVFCGTIFRDCTSLQRVCLSNAIAVVSFYRAFWGCSGILTTIITNTENVADIDQMYDDCPSLIKVEFTDTASLVTGNYTFSNCRNLQEVKNLNLKNVKEMKYMFENCYSLETFNFNSENSTYSIYAYGSFEQCLSLKNVIVSSNTTFSDATNIFANCPSLESISSIKLPADSLSAFSGSYYTDGTSLKDISNIDTSDVVIGQSMFYKNSRLFDVPNLNLNLLQDADSMFLECKNLIDVGSINLANVTSASYLFESCYNLSRSRVYGIKVSHSYENCYNLTGTALNEIFTNLGTPIGSPQTINLTNVLGTADPEFDATIATGKNWTLVY